MEASGAEARGGYLRLSRVTPAELMGCVSGLVLAGSVFLPWFGTSETNTNSMLCGVGGGETCTAFDVYGILDYLLIAAAAAPFILLWIVARGHKLTWKPGEVTMIVGVTAFVLVICNGIVLGRPENAQGESIGITLEYGYLVALIAAIALAVSGFLRQSRYTQGRKPPGVI